MDDPNDRFEDREWRAALAPLGQGGAMPPPELEEAVVGAIRGRRTGARRLRLAFAAMVLLSVGVLAGRWWTLPRSSSSTEPRYLLLLFEGPGFDSLSSSHQARVAEYGGWARDLERRGQLVDAGELAPAERRLGPIAGSAGDLLAGVFIVKARDEAEAMAIASTCPHLKHGGGVSVRLIRSS